MTQSVLLIIGGGIAVVEVPDVVVRASDKLQLCEPLLKEVLAAVPAGEDREEPVVMPTGKLPAHGPGNPAAPSRITTWRSRANRFTCLSGRAWCLMLLVSPVGIEPTTI